MTKAEIKTCNVMCSCGFSDESPKALFYIEQVDYQTAMKITLFDYLCSRAGFGDLKPADRSGGKPLQRQAVWYAMREQGVTFREIAKQSHRTHGTVIVGVQKFKDYLSINDEEAVQMYNILNENDTKTSDKNSRKP